MKHLQLICMIYKKRQFLMFLILLGIQRIMAFIVDVMHLQVILLN